MTRSGSGSPPGLAPGDRVRARLARSMGFRLDSGGGLRPAAAEDHHARQRQPSSAAGAAEAERRATAWSTRSGLAPASMRSAVRPGCGGCRPTDAATRSGGRCGPSRAAATMAAPRARPRCAGSCSPASPRRASQRAGQVMLTGSAPGDRPHLPPAAAGRRRARRRPATSLPGLCARTRCGSRRALHPDGPDVAAFERVVLTRAPPPHHELRLHNPTGRR
jgi:hypothetical protein